MNVLIIEDDIQICTYVANGLKQAGFTTDSANTGDDGYQMARAVDYDALIVDIMLPGMDGITLIEKLRGHGISTPVLILSAKNSLDDKIRGFQSGSDDYITKPFQSAELLARVRTHVRLHQLQQVLPVCSYCGKIRNDDASWEPVETYIRQKTGADLSHGVCPDCYEDIRSQFSHRREDS